MYAKVSRQRFPPSESCSSIYQTRRVMVLRNTLAVIPQYALLHKDRVQVQIPWHSALVHIANDLWNLHLVDLEALFIYLYIFLTRKT